MMQARSTLMESPRNSPLLSFHGHGRSSSANRATSYHNGNNFVNNMNNNLHVRGRYNNNNIYEQSPHGTPVRSASSNRHTANLLASLDKSILQIRDWLTLLEGMIKKDKVDISDRGHIRHMLERQKVC